jgi:hypothetical protein
MHGWQSEPIAGSTNGWTAGLSISLSVCFANYLFVYLFTYLSFYLSICLPVCLFNPLSNYLSVYLSMYLFVRPICLSVGRSTDLPFGVLSVSLFAKICVSMGLTIYLPRAFSGPCSSPRYIIDASKLTICLPNCLFGYLFNYRSICRYLYLYDVKFPVVLSFRLLLPL